MKNIYGQLFAYLLIIFLTYTNINFAQTFNWAKNAGGINFDNGSTISKDANGNSYVTGTIREAATFGSLQLVSYGYDDIFIAKYDASGNCLWAKNAGGIGYDYGYGIATDANGNSYVTGSFYGTATFGTIQLVSYGYDDIFIAKYDASGNCIWVKKAGGINWDFGYSISTDGNGNEFITGIFKMGLW